MTASRLLDDIQKQADVTAYLLELLDDEELVNQVAMECTFGGGSRERAVMARYGALLKQRLREGK